MATPSDRFATALIGTFLTCGALGVAIAYGLTFYLEFPPEYWRDTVPGNDDNPPAYGVVATLVVLGISGGLALGMAYLQELVYISWTSPREVLCPKCERKQQEW